MAKKELANLPTQALPRQDEGVSAAQGHALREFEPERTTYSQSKSMAKLEEYFEVLLLHQFSAMQSDQPTPENTTHVQGQRAAVHALRAGAAHHHPRAPFQSSRESIAVYISS